LSPGAPLNQFGREELIALILELQKQNAELRAEIERLKRSHFRQAAPFSKDQPKSNPNKPGRKPGQGIFRYRSAPPQPPTETVTAQAPLDCPHCGGCLEQVGEEIATTTDVPSCPQPVVTAYRVPVCRCRKCGTQVRGQVAGLSPYQTGATAHRLGPGVMAAAHALHYGIGIPVRKVPAVLQELTGVCVTQSALTQDALCRARGAAGEVYEHLRQAVRDAPAVHTDDTGWRIAGKTAFLMGFDTDQATVYQIRSQHRNEEVREVIPADYGGVLVSDRGKSYDAEEFAQVSKQKCLAHLIRNVCGVVESKQGRARQFGVTLNALLREGLALWHARRDLTSDELAIGIQQLDLKLTRHLRIRMLRDPDNQRLLDGIGLQHDRGHVMRFLKTEGVEPTNNRAERILRPAVIARKVSHCSKNQPGANAFAAFTSIAQTALKNGAASVASAFRSLFSLNILDSSV